MLLIGELREGYAQLSFYGIADGIESAVAARLELLYLAVNFDIESYAYVLRAYKMIVKQLYVVVDIYIGLCKYIENLLGREL